MTRKLTCIECPKGCALSVDIENCRVVKVDGEKCPKGKDYAVSEIENPVRVLASTVVSQGLSLKMIPVRTNKAIPKSKILEAVASIRKISLNKPVKAGEVVLENLLGLGVDVVATRECI